MASQPRFPAAVASLFFRDPARPVEWLSLVDLIGWGWWMLVAPQVLEGESYAAFRALPSWVWGTLMLATASAQLAALRSGRATTRFVAMACASGLWAVVAIHFMAASVPTTGVVNYAGLAALTALTGVWLGWAKTSS